VLKKECTTIVCAKHECIWNVLLEFLAINEEFFSSDLTMDVFKAGVVLHNFLARELVISLRTL
jgi:hypothetical protein